MPTAAFAAARCPDAAPAALSRGRVVHRAWLILGLLLGAGASGQLAAAAWSGTIVLAEEIVGPAGTSGSDRIELDQYVHVLTERRAHAEEEVHLGGPAIVMRTLREDIASANAELDRVALARGGAVQVGETRFILRGPRMLVEGDSPRTIVDRAADQARLLGSGRIVSLAPMPEPVPIADGVPAKPQLGYALARFDARAEGKACTIAVATALPNPFAIGLLSDASDQKDTLAYLLATMPGMPMQVAYQADGVTHRWQVVEVDPGDLGDGAAEVAGP